MGKSGRTVRRTGALEESDFRNLAENAPVMMWRANAEKQFDWFNKRWLTFVGRPIEREIGHGWREGVHPDDEDRRWASFEASFESRRPFSLHYRLLRGDGEYRWLLDSGAPFERAGVFAGYSGSCVDVTELFTLEAHKDSLLAELNHRVKNNLQLVIAFLSFSAGRATGEEARILLGSTIRRIQGVGAIQEQLHRCGSEVIDLALYLPTLARSALEMESAMSLQVEVESVMSPFPQASSLGLIVNELMTNAVEQARFHDGEIQIRLRLRRLDEGRAEITVAHDRSGLDFENAADSAGAGDGPHRVAGLIDTLARHAQAIAWRDNEGGVRVSLVFPTTGSRLPKRGSGDHLEPKIGPGVFSDIN